MMLLNILYCMLIMCCIVYIEKETFIIDRVFAHLFPEKEIPEEVMPGFVNNTYGDTEEIQTKEMLQEEINYMNEYIFKHVDKDNSIIDIDLEDDDYIPLTPTEVA